MKNCQKGNIFGTAANVHKAEGFHIEAKRWILGTCTETKPLSQVFDMDYSKELRLYQSKLVYTIQQSC